MWSVVDPSIRDDLDQFTREGKLKDAVELLELIEKEMIRVDLPQFMALVRMRLLLKLNLCTSILRS